MVAGKHDAVVHDFADQYQLVSIIAHLASAKQPGDLHDAGRARPQPRSAQNGRLIELRALGKGHGSVYIHGPKRYCLPGGSPAICGRLPSDNVGPLGGECSEVE